MNLRELRNRLRPANGETPEVAVADLLNLSCLVMLIAANSTPVVAAWLLGTTLNAPIDAGICAADGRRLLGSHKTWRGFASGTLASGLVGWITPAGLWIGLGFGALALTGDLISSYVKRRLAVASGGSVPLLDQLPEALLPMVLLQPVLGLHLPEILGTAAFFAILDAATTRFRT